MGVPEGAPGGPRGAPGPGAPGAPRGPGAPGRGPRPGGARTGPWPGYPFGGPADQCYKACPRWVNASGLAPDGSMHRGLPQRGNPSSNAPVTALRLALATGLVTPHCPALGGHAEHGVPTALKGGRTLRLNDLSINTDPIGWSPSCPCLGRVAPTLCCDRCPVSIALRLRHSPQTSSTDRALIA